MAFSTADKSKPFLPLAGSANDGWSTEDEATATCFCGAVQLKFVRSPLSCFLNQFWLMSLTVSTANPRPRSCQLVRLQLLRLPQGFRLHVCLQLHHR